MLGPLQILPVSGLPDVPPGDDLAGAVRGEAPGLATDVVRCIDPIEGVIQ